MSKQSPSDSDLVKLVRELEVLKQDLVDAEAVIADADDRENEAQQALYATTASSNHARQQASNAIELTNVQIRQLQAMLTQQLGLVNRVDECCGQTEPSRCVMPGNRH